MSYYFSRTLTDISFEEAIAKTSDALSKAGFGILTEIDMKSTFKNKLNKDITPYRILGACNPPNAYKAVKAEPNIGLMLPCNVIVRQTEGGVEVAAVDPVASMQAVENEELEEVALEVQKMMQDFIDNLNN